MATTLASSEEDETIQFSVQETNGGVKTIAIEAGKASLQRPTVSMLARLKAPTAADTVRKHKTKTNFPHVG